MDCREFRTYLDTLPPNEKTLVECAWYWYCGWKEEAYDLMTDLIKKVVKDG